MPSTHKKQHLSKQSISDEEIEDDEIIQDGEIQAEFEGRNLEVQDFHGIKQLLKQLFLKAHIDLSQLTDLLINQNGVGSVLKQSMDDDEDDDDDMTDTGDVFGITSVINLSAHKNTPSVQQLTTVIVNLFKQHSDKTVATRVESILASSRVGLIINERFINIPAKIADPLFTSLQNELSRIVKKDVSYDFDYYCMFCKTYMPKGKDDVIYLNAEEEVFAKMAELNLHYNVSADCDTGIGGKWSEGDEEMIPHRQLFILKGHNFSNFTDKIKEILLS